MFGSVDPGFIRSAALALPRMVEEVRKQLQNQADRRTAMRVAADFAMEVYPVSGAGEVLAAIPARCVDVSTGGVCFLAASAVPSSYIFASFVELPVTAGWAILTRLIRSKPEGSGQLVSGRYRLDLYTS